MKHVVKYTESERGWMGGEVWYTEFATREEALAAEKTTNDRLPKDHVPEYYIKANYVGYLAETPKGYKF